MASFGGVDLGTGGSAVFELLSESDDEDWTHTFPDGSAVIIPGKSKFVVVRQCPGVTFDEVHGNARELANQGIDIYFGLGSRPLVMAQKDSTYVVAWMTRSGHTLRIVGINQISTRLRARGQTFDIDGNPVVQPPAPAKRWHESLRYYRVSESSSDLYDSFRNLYLAIESLLSYIVPPMPKPTTGHLEGDSEWLKRALRVVGEKLDLSPYSPPSDKRSHNAIHQDLYLNLRTAIFHAKVGRVTWRPQTWSSRATIVEARYRYAQMFRNLAAQYLDIPYPAGAIVKTFWEITLKAQLENHEVFISNDPTRTIDEKPGKHELAPAGGAFLKLHTVACDDMAADWRRGVIGTAAASAVHADLGELWRFGTLLDGEVAIIESLNAPLSVENLAGLEVVLLLEGRNYGQPRQDFES